MRESYNAIPNSQIHSLILSLMKAHPNQTQSEIDEWLLLLAYIGAKRTLESGFKQLFQSILENPAHAYYSQAHKLKMQFDFSPLRSVNDE